MLEMALKYLAVKAGPTMLALSHVVCYDQPNDYFVMMAFDHYPETHLKGHIRHQFPNTDLIFTNVEDIIVEKNENEWTIKSPFVAHLKYAEKKELFTLTIDRESATPLTIDCRNDD